MNSQVYNGYREYGLDFETNFFIKHEEILTKIYFEFMSESSNRFGFSLFLRSSGLDRYLLRTDITNIGTDNGYEEWAKYCEEAKEIRNILSNYMDK